MPQINPGQAGNTMSNNKYFTNGMKKSFGRKAKKFNKLVTEDVTIGKNNHITVFFQIDRNGSVADCTRVGDTFDKYHGKPWALVCPIEGDEGILGHLKDEIKKIQNPNAFYHKRGFGFARYATEIK